MYALFMSSCALRVRHLIYLFSVFFFFQAEDGIRDSSVTGVQTCALPIFTHEPPPPGSDARRSMRMLPAGIRGAMPRPTVMRSEERRVGKECRSRWSPYH